MIARRYAVPSWPMRRDWQFVGSVLPTWQQSGRPDLYG